MSNINMAEEFLKELNAEVPPTRKCLERIPEKLFEYKPHEKSMKLGYLTLLTAEIPKWITTMLAEPEIDLATYPHIDAKTTAEVVEQFDKNIKDAQAAFKKSSNEILEEEFSLKGDGHVLMTATKKEMIASTLNHWVHHRGQLTVYMRLNDIDVPSIYGPSADDKGF